MLTKMGQAITSGLVLSCWIDPIKGFGEKRQVLFINALAKVLHPEADDPGFLFEFCLRWR